MARAERLRRGSMNFRVLCTLLACGVLFLLVACKTRTTGADLDAQPSTQPDTQPTKPKPGVVARVLGADIVAADLAGTTQPEPCRELAVRLTAPLIEAYRQENNITADEAEIIECQTAFARLTDRAPFSESFAQRMIVLHKIERQLYLTYGGEVIFQQASPFQPVGAYRAFLKEQERLGRFDILDDDYRGCFWEQYSTANASVWPVSEVDFSQPWWMRTKTP